MRGASKVKPIDPPRRIRWMVGTSVLTMLIAVLALPFIRDAYRNQLCTSYGGGRVLVSVEEWEKRYQGELIKITRVARSEARTKLSDDMWRETLNSRFSEETKFERRGLGVTEHDYRLVDTASGVVLATWVRYYTESWGRVLILIGLPMSESCFVGGREYLSLRARLSARASK
jgi:hypothetical protein